jgi:hypothetical protein
MTLAKTLVQRFVMFAVPAALIFAACGDSTKRRPLGDACSEDTQCESGLCVASLCVDPEGDADGDGLVNHVERSLGTTAENADTDGDGRDDRTEVGADSANPLDFDGDGRIDARESSLTDSDADCLVDERDPANDTPDDAAVLARYGCCCDGLCDAVGHETTAQCVDGALVCENPQPDRDGDGTPDRCDTRLFDLGADARVGSCARVCEELAANCPGAGEGCVTECETLAADEDFWVSNFQCQAATCNRDACFGAAATFPEPDNCVDACEAMLGCGLGASFGIDDPDFCRIACAGVSQAGGEDAALVACLADVEVGTECNILDVMPCIPEMNLCGTACSRLVPGADRFCPASAPIFDTFADAPACRDACNALDGYGRVAFLGCVTGSGCSKPEMDCTAIARPTDTFCAEVCSTIRTECALESWPDEPFCAVVCEGFRAQVPWTNLTTAKNCLAARIDGCSNGFGELMQPLLGCMAQVSPTCADYCSFADGCFENNPADCGEMCTIVSLELPERMEAVTTCVDGLETCDGFLECFSIQPAAVCSPACLQQLACDPDAWPSAQACIQACASELGLGGTNYARWACRVLDTQCDANCAALDGVPPLTECQAACARTDACHEHAYGLCEAACTAFEHVYPETTDPTCLPAALGPRCDLPAAARSCAL